MAGMPFSKPLIAASLVGLVGLVAYYFGFVVGVDNADLRLALLPWFEELVTRGPSAVAGEYSNYAPPYLYLLWLSSLADGPFSHATLIKAVSLFFTIFAGFIVFLIIREFGRSPATSAAGAILFVCLPTIVLNGIYWGQCDIIYASLLLVFFLMSLRKMPTAATIFFGVALAFKAQAIIMAPYLLFLVLAKEVSARTLVLVPLTYLVMMIPAAIAGRPWEELLTVYLHQAQTYQFLALNAPNLYTLLQDYSALSYTTGLIGGILLTAIVGLAIAIGGLQFARNGETQLLIATSSALFIPFVLPKMHDRYFFLADVFSFVLAFTIRKGWSVALLVQVASILAYTKFLFGFAYGPALGALVMTGAVVALALLITQQGPRGHQALVAAGR